MDLETNQEHQDTPSLNLLLVGKTGSGISSTCKSIDSSSQAFELGGFASVTETIETGSAQFEDAMINIVATPGFRNDSSSKEEAQQYIKNVICQAFQHSPTGFNAIVFVLSYVERINLELANAIKDLKSILGQNALKKYGVLLVTHADSLHNDLGETKTVEEWRENQTGFFKALYDECNSRCVQFDNVTQDATKKEEQLRSLVENVRQIESVYSYDTFAAENLPFIWEGNLPRIKEAILTHYRHLSEIRGIKWVSLPKMTDEERKRMQEKVRASKEDVKSFIAEDERITLISSLKEVVDSIDILVEITEGPGKRFGEDSGKLKDFKTKFDKNFPKTGKFTFFG